MNMNQAQVLSLVRTILKTVGASLVTGGYLTDGTLELVIGLVLAISGVLWSHFSPEKKADPKDGITLPVVPLLVTFLSLGAVLPFTGCQTIRDNPETVKAVLRVGLRLATHAVIQKNPDLSPYLTGVSDLLFNIPFAASPDQVNAKVSALVDAKVSDPVHRESLRDVTDLALSFYADVYSKFRDRLTDEQLNSVLRAMAEAIAQGVSPSAVAGPDAGPVLSLASGQIVVE